MAQLVEHLLAKQEVASSNLVNRSKPRWRKLRQTRTVQARVIREGREGPNPSRGTWCGGGSRPYWSARTSGFVCPRPPHMARWAGEAVRHPSAKRATHRGPRVRISLSPLHVA